ncbi:family 43 glycosylhydrolase [Hymenobacter weizhouensis]|uniref:family 43 glycosylhydrolase n=1 Tax=Hymenobacter sp. YIM 151500-1 TaxID=2987689 RepID=UPI0022276A8E|nr:family 43 glycosylhydrolase [Hymenobacter sp. YIM 151500-1]UYZ63689.1 family 43 glycosylhydrolase [Hymenobacter sp. YIM 151500-1]
MAQTSGNPVIGQYQADPDIDYFNGRYYIYPTGGNQFRAYSSTDLTNWRDDGVIFDLGPQCSWANTNGWAPDMVERNGKYYFYYTAEAKIGVAVGNSPTGPFTDLGYALVGSDPYTVDIIDAMVFVDDDGQAYLYYGGSNGSRMVIRKLNANMTSFSGSPTLATPQNYTEAPFLLKRNGIYYLMYSNGAWYNGSYNVQYATSSSPMGPWTYKGTILSSSGPFSGPGHHAVLRRPGCYDEYYVAYHRYENGDYSTRKVCLDRMYFRPNGDILPINMTWTGVAARSGSAGCIADQDISTGTYRLVSKLSSSNQTIVLDVSECSDKQDADVRTWRWQGGNCQRWRVEKTGDGFYKITSQLPSHRALDLSGCDHKAGTDVRAYSDNGLDCQRWRIEAVGDGYYRLVSKQSGNVLDVSGCNATPGTDVRTWNWLGGNCQRWKFEAVADYERPAPAAATPAPSSELTVAPNPAVRQLMVRQPFAETGPVDLTLVDALGRTVLHHRHLVRKGPQQLTLEVGSVAPGVYLLRVDQGRHHAAQRVSIGQP